MWQSHIVPARFQAKSNLAGANLPTYKRGATPMKHLISVSFLILLACSVASAPINLKVIPPIDFPSNHLWVEVPAGATDQQLKQLIRTEVIRLIDQNKQPISYEKAIAIFQDWMEEKQELNDLWKRRMLELGTQLRDRITQVSKLREQSISQKNQIDVQDTQLEAIQQTLRNDSLAMERYHNEKEFLKKNLESQLEDISYMVVVLGKRELGVIENLSDVREIIGSQMMVEAIREINGTRIMAETTVKNYQLVRDYVKAVESGHAQVLDSYTNDFAKLSRGVDVRYLVQAIEVSPFRSRETETKSQRPVSAEPTVNIITRQNINQIWRDNNLTDDPTKTPIKDFILQLLSQVDRQNRGINAKIRKFHTTYQERLTGVNSKITAVENDLLVHGNQLMQIQLDYTTLKQNYDSYDQLTLKPAVENLKDIDQTYHNHYNLRVFLADKSEEGFLQKSQKDEYCSIASSTVDKMKEYKESEYTNTVVAVNFQLDSYSESLVTYSPNVRAFTILYLTRKELSTDVSYVACVGYQMEWKPKSTPTTPLTTGGKLGKIQGPLPDMEFVLIPGGSFMMGSPLNESGRGSDEGPQHNVTTQPIYMMTTEVTQAQWKVVMGNNPSRFKGDNRPVENVSWNDCQQFIAKLNQTDPGKGYRLPTEAEWEYACRAGTTTRFHSGYSEMDLAKAGWYGENSRNTTHPVGTKTPNSWGLYDMHGNVWEWCEDWYHRRYYRAPSNGTAWISGGGTYRVLRGGSWDFYEQSCRSANRDGNDLDIRRYIYGFRCVRNP